MKNTKNLLLNELSNKNKLTIYILSLETDIERRIFISENLNKFGLNFEFVNAPDGRKKNISRSSQSVLTNTEAACARGHIEIYKKLLGTNQKIAIILEDDVKVNENSIKIFDRLINYIYDKIDENTNESSVYILGGIGERKIFPYFVGFIKKRIEFLEIKKCYMSEDKIYGTCCYIINRKAAELIIKDNADLIHFADDWGGFKKRNIVNNFYIVEPSIFIHPTVEDSSHIEKDRKERVDNNQSKLKKILKKLHIHQIKHFSIFSYRSTICFVFRFYKSLIKLRSILIK